MITVRHKVYLQIEDVLSDILGDRISGENITVFSEVEDKVAQSTWDIITEPLMDNIRRYVTALAYTIT